MSVFFFLFMAVRKCLSKITYESKDLIRLMASEVSGMVRCVHCFHVPGSGYHGGKV